MKKVKVFITALLVAIALLGFSGTSYAFDLSKITSKPVEFVKYVAGKLGFGDSDEEKPQDGDDAKEVTVKESPYNSETTPGTLNSDLYAIDFTRPVIQGGISQIYGWQGYNEGVNYIYGIEDRYFRIGSRTGDTFSPFSNEFSSIPVWQTRMEYRTGLPWESFSQLSSELFIESNFTRQQTFGLNGTGPESIHETFSLRPDSMNYGLRVNALVRDAKIGLYGWYGDDPEFLSSVYSYPETRLASSDFLWRTLDSDYYQGSNNLAAAVSFELPFMGNFHQGMSPSVRFETAYRLGSNSPETSSLIEDNAQLKIGMAYEGNNRIPWLNSYGVNWGVGYNYTITLNDLDDMDNFRQNYGSYSGNINANTYWFNMKLHTMFMYLYDRQTRGSMTVLNATYSPDWRWSYGIRANFYYGNKEGDSTALKNNSELVTFTATYRWD